MKILIVKTSSLGDVIHMLPAVTDATKALPQLQIDWLVEDSFAAVPAWHPGVRNVIPVHMRRWRKQLTSRRTWKEMGAVRQTLRQSSYELMIDSQGLVKSAIWTLIDPVPSAGYDRHSIREPLASWFYQRRLSIPLQQHAIERCRQLMAQTLGYATPRGGPDYGLQALPVRLAAPPVTLPPGSIVGLHGTSRASKLWPVANWIALAQGLKKIERTLVLPFGNDAEQQRARHIAALTENVLVLPRLDLDGMAWTLNQAQAVVGVDTGLLHLAAALGKPGLALYTATPPGLTGAVSDRHCAAALRNLSAPADLEPGAVMQALIELLVH